MPVKRNRRKRVKDIIAKNRPRAMITPFAILESSNKASPKKSFLIWIKMNKMPKIPEASHRKNGATVVL